MNTEETLILLNLTIHASTTPNTNTITKGDG